MQWTDFQRLLAHIAPAEQERIKSAFQWGEKAHDGQKRKSGEPYFQHPIIVAGMLAESGADSDTIIAALLHDTVEDTSVTLDDVEKKFGHTVRNIVEGVTKLTSTDMTRPTLNEQTETLRKIFTLMQKDVRIMVIKLVDRLHNMQTAKYLAPEKQQLLAKETYDVYVKIAERLSMQDMRAQLEALSLHILEPVLFTHLERLREENEIESERIIGVMKEELQKSFDLTHHSFDVFHEHKTWEQLRTQLSTDGNTASGLATVTTVFICPTIDECYATLGMLHQLWQRQRLTFEDYINSPLVNGYKGLHTTIILKDGTRVRCKIRTPEMHQYARKGVMTKCFDSEAMGLAEYLPWTKHISSLAEGTSRRSDEFWESLQSDILGDAIVIHSPGDETVQLPKGATALDGVFYLFLDDALQVQTITVNGHEVPFDRLLQHGDSLNITLSSHLTVDRRWLQWVQTGIATTTIRSTLATILPTADQVIMGKELLQQMMTERRQGFIEEFDERVLLQRLQPLGFSSLQETFIAIANGNSEVAEVYDALFEQTTTAAEQETPHLHIIRYAINMDDIATMDRVGIVHRQYSGALQEIRYKRGKLSSNVTLQVLLTSPHINTLLSSLSNAGAKDVHVVQKSKTLLTFSIISIFLLWGLDPVFAKLILENGVGSASFTTIRAMSIFFFAIVMLIWTGRHRSFARISLSYSSLWIAGVSFFFINLFTYMALTYGSPVLYNTILRGNAFLLTAPLLLQHKRFGIFFFSSLFTIGGLLLLVRTGESVEAFTTSIGVLFFFAIYTIASRHFQKSAYVLARYPQFFFFTSAVAAICATVMLAITPVSFPDLTTTILLAAYCFCFIGIPYFLYYRLTREIGYPALSPWINVSLVITIVGQVFFIDAQSIIIFLGAATLFILGSLLASRTADKYATDL